MAYTMQRSRCFIRGVAIFESSQNPEGLKNNTEITYINSENVPRKKNEIDVNMN